MSTLLIFSFSFCIVSLLEACSLTPPTNGVCGKCGTTNRDGSKIVSGTSATLGEIPWQVGLDSTAPNYADPFYLIFGPSFFCGGTLINANWVLTAAHCTSGKSPQSIWAHLGKTNRKSIIGGLVLQIYSKVEHPSYNSFRTGYDISLLRLHQGVNLNNSPNINSVCWPTRTPTIGLQVMASGWGLTFQHFGLFGTPKLLQKATLSVMSDSQCRDQGSTVGSAVVCAWGNNAYVCNGDSGGPLVGLNNGVWELYGATSFGNIFCKVNYSPAGFGDVYDVIGWVSGIAGSECSRA